MNLSEKTLPQLKSLKERLNTLQQTAVYDMVCERIKTLQEWENEKSKLDNQGGLSLTYLSMNFKNK